MLQRFPIITRLVCFIIGPILFATSGAVYYLKGSLPSNRESIQVIDISSEIYISRDSNGVPTIAASSDLDAFFGLGFVHAQDRLWQLEYQRRMLEGRLSETLGRNYLDQDIWFRTLDLYRHAESAWLSLGTDARSSLTAYSQGINAWISADKVLPIEFWLLSVEPKEWREVDSLAVLKLFALNLAGNFRNELLNQSVIGVLPEEKLSSFLAKYPTDMLVESLSETEPLIFQEAEMSEVIARQNFIESKQRIGGRNAGSNVWVISPKVNSGITLLANDPHLGAQIPAPWYAANMKGDTLQISGMTAVGLPTVVFGHNERIAWGITNMMADTQDLYLEKVNPLNLSQYDSNGNWEPFMVRDEVINIKSDFPSFIRKEYSPVFLKIRETSHGPVINNIGGNISNNPVTLRWTALNSDDTSYEAFYKLMYARDWDSFQDSLRYLVAPTLNFAYADVSDNIGYLGAGKIPIRNLGEGFVPIPSSNTQNYWKGYIPFEDMPKLFNPENGYFINANDKVTSINENYFISHDWASPERAERILELVDSAINENEQALTIDDMWKIQLDDVSLSAKKILPYLTKLTGVTEKSTSALSILRIWDGSMSKESAAAPIFNLWMNYLREEIFLDELLVFGSRTGNFQSLSEIVSRVELSLVRGILDSDELGWCDDIDSSDVENCDDMLRVSLASAIEDLEISLGSDMSNWRWGDIHQIALNHGSFDGRILKQLFDRKIPSSGSEDTINAANGVYLESEGFVQTLAPNFRQVIRINGGEIDYFYLHLAGQSGNVLSENYDHMLESFQNKESYGFENIRTSEKPKSHLELIPIGR